VTAAILWTHTTARATRAVVANPTATEFALSSFTLAVDALGGTRESEWSWSIYDGGLHRTLATGVCATREAAMAACERVACAMLRLLGRTVTLRNAGGLPRITGRLECNGHEWSIVQRSGFARGLVGVGHEHVIEAAIVANATEAA
jgi:hypothetical protein